MSVVSNKLLRNKSRKLRIKGKTYTEIQKALDTRISKSTLSYWCKDVRLPPFYKSKIKKLNESNLQKARISAIAVNKQKREKYLKKLLNKNLSSLNLIDVRVQKMLLAILYLAEGAKHKSTRMLLLGSSKPEIIKFYMALLKNCFSISDEKFRIRIQCRYDQNLKVLEKFWQKTTGVSRNQFYPTYKDKRTKGVTTRKKDYKGVCVVHYFDTEIQLELELLADAIMNKIIEGR